MSPSSGKASGKTDGFTPIWPGVVPEEHQNCCSYTPQLVKRIAELEAELASVEAQRDEWTRIARERAEKAEAEVERLSLLSQKPRENVRCTCKDHLRLGSRHFSDCPVAIVGVNPSGDTLGRKERASSD